MSKAKIIIDEFTSFGDDLEEDHRKISFYFDPGDASVDIRVFDGKEDPTISDEAIDDFVEGGGHMEQAAFEWEESDHIRVEVADIDSMISGLTRIRQFIIARYGKKYLNDID